MPTSLLDSSRFIPLANLVAEHGIRYFVEANATDTDGMEAAKRLNLHAHIHNEDTRTATVFSERYPDFDLYDGDTLAFLRAVVPKLDAPAYFLLDRSSPTFAKEEAVIQEASSRTSLWQDWFVDAKGEPPPLYDVSQNIVLNADGTVSKCALGGNSLEAPGSYFNKSEAFDTNWHGPEELRPRVYRTQSEKDTWHAVVVDNEYKLGPLEPSDVVIDIGAHIGSFSYLAHLKGSRKVYGFEVDPWHMEAARANTEGLNGIYLFEGAVVRSDAKRSPTYRYNGQWNVFGDEGKVVPSISLDEAIENFGHVRFLKTDSEGSEWPILYTCTKLDQVEEIAGEYHEDCAFEDDSLPPKTMTALAKYLWERWGFHVTFTTPAPGIGNFYAKR